MSGVFAADEASSEDEASEGKEPRVEPGFVFADRRVVREKDLEASYAYQVCHMWRTPEAKKSIAKVMEAPSTGCSKNPVMSA